ncbi:sulfate permease, SulP family [Verrucomicrobium sp. GAS474]|uniref:SLC26A/SulP transporter family protein n=1 Tax=Verrucomicrobium sp. GAS474 TaxID=1882831 RepID=UPI00087AEEA5|nr:SulP family inorganic anion transporter [Verrucomicrobium sp. GAS474]SDT91587.1 sulfate permease, SulP family [Verrucomicrobium sp. GAS474]
MRPSLFAALSLRLGALWSEVGHAPVAPSLISGMIVAMMASVMGVSFAALVFGGELSGWIPYGVSLFLLGALLLGGGTALLSAFPGSITVPQDRFFPILGLMAVGMTATLHGAASPDDIARTVLATIAIASLLTGLAFYLLGRFGLGNLIRFIPYPVVGGFLAGSGWLLFSGSFRVMTGSTLALASLPALGRPETAALWVPGLLFGTVLWAVLRWRPHVLAVPTLLAVGVGLFYLAVALLHLPLAHMRETGWLLKSLPSVPVTELHGLFAARGVHWEVVAAQGGFLSALLLTAVISLLLNITAIELTADREIDLNAELRVAGWVNLAGGVAGSSPGFLGLSLTRLPLSFGASNRLTGLVYAACCGAILLCGTAFLSYIPKFVLGGFLLYLGLSMLMEWIVDGRRQLPAADYGVMLLILIVIGTVGYLQGIAVGIVAASALFIVGYGRVSVVARRLTGAEQRSNVDRAEADTHLLQEKGRGLLILKLQGFIFFGSANKLYDTARDRLALPGEEPLRFVLLDLGQVTGLDSSALLSLVKMRKLGAKRGFRLVLVVSPASARLRAQIEAGGLLNADGARLFPDRDHGLEWCEDEILNEVRLGSGIEVREEDVPLLLYLQRHWPADSNPTRLDRYLERVGVSAGEPLFRQGEPSRELYFVEEGRVRVELELGDGRVIRLRSLLKGTVVGELGFYLHSARGATVRAETACTLRRLTDEGLRRMEAEEPGAALVFHHYMSRFLADRMTYTNRALQAALE